MSWMDSWSRPSANSTIPAPLYLSGDNVPYCHTCGRAMTSKKSAKKTENIIKYCSDRCRSRKPGSADKKIEKAITALLNGEKDSGIDQTEAQSRKVKGDPRNIITCDEIEEIIYGSRFDPDKIYGRRKNRKSRAIRVKPEDWKSVDMESSEAEFTASSEDEAPQMGRPGGAPIRPPQDQSEVNFSVGGERNRAERIEESAADLEKRREGDRRAEERENVRRAARRVVIFGVEVSKPIVEQKPAKKTKRSKQHDEGEEEHTTDDSTTMMRKAEAIMGGTVVEPSYAKGNWSIRWRE